MANSFHVIKHSIHIAVEFLFNRIEDQNLNRPELQKPGEQVNESSRIEPSIGAGSPAKNVMPTNRKSSLLQGDSDLMPFLTLKFYQFE